MKKGFTLVEILVVVLIIGVLSSIALAQYQRAVKRSRGAEALAAISAIKTALSAYGLENGGFDMLTNGDALSVSLPSMKHWQYCQVGTQCGYFDNTTTSNDFPGCLANNNQSDCQVGLINEDGVALNLVVSSPSRAGRIQFSLSCAGSFEACADYFPCEKRSYSQYSSTTNMDETKTFCALSL